MYKYVFAKQLLRGFVARSVHCGHAESREIVHFFLILLLPATSCFRPVMHNMVAQSMLLGYSSAQGAGTASSKPQLLQSEPVELFAAAWHNNHLSLMHQRADQLGNTQEGRAGTQPQRHGEVSLLLQQRTIQ